MTNSEAIKSSYPSNPDVRCAVAAGEAHFVGADGPPGSLPKSTQKSSLTVSPPSAAQSSCNRDEPVSGHVGIKLVVPRAVERIGDVQPLAVEAQLQHLRPAGECDVPSPIVSCPARPPHQTCAASFGWAGSLTSYRRMSPCSQSEKYSQRSSSDSDQVGDQPRHGKRPALTFDRRDLDHLFDLPGLPADANATSCC